MKKTISITTIAALLAASIFAQSPSVGPATIPSPAFTAPAAITPNGPNVQYEYEVTGVSLLATGATTVFTTASGLGRFRIANWSVEITSVSGSSATGTLTASVGISANSYLDGSGQISLASGRLCWSQATGIAVANCYISATPGLNQVVQSGGASIPASTAVAFNVTSALATATTVGATVRVWGFYE